MNQNLASIKILELGDFKLQWETYLPSIKSMKFKTSNFRSSF